MNYFQLRFALSACSDDIVTPATSILVDSVRQDDVPSNSENSTTIRTTDTNCRYAWQFEPAVPLQFHANVSIASLTALAGWRPFTYAFDEASAYLKSFPSGKNIS